MAKYMEELKEMLKKELKEIIKKGRIIKERDIKVKKEQEK